MHRLVLVLQRHQLECKGEEIGKKCTERHGGEHSPVSCERAHDAILAERHDAHDVILKGLEEAADFLVERVVDVVKGRAFRRSGLRFVIHGF